MPLTHQRNLAGQFRGFDPAFAQFVSQRADALLNARSSPPFSRVTSRRMASLSSLSFFSSSLKATRNSLSLALGLSAINFLRKSFGFAAIGCLLLALAQAVGRADSG
jgi:hypothetical protein